MKNKKLLIVLLLAVMIISICACTTTEESSVVVVVTKLKNNVTIDVTDLPYDFTTLFAISEDGKLKNVLSDYIDTTDVPSGVGSGMVTCNYGGKSATINVNVISGGYQLNLLQDSISVKPSEVDGYDFLSLFTATFCGASRTVDKSCVTSNVKAEVGNYTYTVNYHGLTSTLNVKVTNNATVTANKTSVTIKDTDIDTYDYTSLFSAYRNEKSVVIRDYFLDLSGKSTTGDWVLTCNYEDATASVNIHVLLTNYVVTLDTPTITLHTSQVIDYDFLQYFTAYTDGSEVAITSNMITNNVQQQAGNYTYTVTNGTASQVLGVVVSDSHIVEVVNSYSVLQLPISQVDSYDYTKLFSLYVDGVATKVTSDMIKTSLLSTAKVGDNVSVSLEYTPQDESTPRIFIAPVSIVSQSNIAISTINKVTYPNSAPIDLTSLFTLTDENGVDIDVTSDMISGAVDYNNVGDNAITLSYGDVQATAIVTIKNGVVIEGEDTVVVLKGTDKSTYLFENDFTIVINGVRYWTVPDSFIDVSAVDFSEEGTYTATITVPYNTKKVSSFGGVSFTNYTKQITYKVVSKTYTIERKQDVVALSPSETSYNLLSNLSVTINGLKQTLTANPNYVDVISCYAKVISGDIDYSSIATQTVLIDVYVYGPESDPVRVSYDVIVSSGVVVSAKDMVITTGTTLYTKDLFAISENGSSISVTSDMISGKVDTFTPGIYYVNIEYRNIVKTASVVVLENAFVGTYHTALKTLSVASSTDDEGYTTDGVKSQQIGDLVITPKFNITFDGRKAEIVSVIDANTLYLKVGSSHYTMHYANGIVVLDFDNSIKLSFSDGRRPLVYFNESIWNIESHFVVNYGSSYVLDSTNTGYSFDMFKVTKIDGTESNWFALKTRLVEKTSADTVYDVSWGNVTIPSDFAPVVGNDYSFIFDGVTYNFTATSKSVGKINKESDNLAFAGKSFTGSVDGKSATLKFSANENITYACGATMLSFTQYELNSMANGGIDHINNTVLLYSFANGKYYSYKFALDCSNNTFTLLSRDKLFGYYTNGNMFLFFDGYGTGVINFDKSTTTVGTSFTYKIVGGEVEITYFNVSSSFSHGSGATLYISSLLNVLTGKYFDEQMYVGMEFTNQYITDGAIINVTNSQMPRYASATEAKEIFLAGISIVTASGEWTTTDKTNNIDLSCVKFSKAGAYKYTIKVQVAGETIAVDYSLIVLQEIYTGNAIVNNYTSAVAALSSSLVIDEYGVATLCYQGAMFSGKVTINNDNTTFVVRANGDAGVVVLKGTLIDNGIVYVTASGVLSFSDYFITGKTYSIGAENIVLRAVVVGAKTIYLASRTTSSSGEVVDVVLNSGTSIFCKDAVISVNSNSFNFIARILEWGDTKTGLTYADRYIGTYTLENNESIVVDGFGGITVGEKSGSYTANSSNVLLVKFDDGYTAYKLFINSKTYKVYDIAFDYTLLSDKTFIATHSFVCNSTDYSATTSFTFGSDGSVICKSISGEHDTDEETKCSQDSYSPSFASQSGVSGRYTIDGNIVTIFINDETFVMQIDDIVVVVSFTCLSTTVDSQAHGYFVVGTQFICY